MPTLAVEERVNELETRVSVMENKVGKPDLFLIEKEEIMKARAGVKGLVELKKKVMGKWKSKASSVEEVRSMRKHKRGY
ncbi:MAG: hypothetical protein KKA99_06640 [Gammaproteobacteria bacterium]|nr:hypothetical protein [Gammaproteobacteria bacterium]MBU1262254.1 hypothetical protein [bacterium]MBU1599410.1 hypothetical protein [bacterium]MBU1629440.1 hypothetical protein [Gammaproteobacteria bacterium]MBU1927349.1 hypothetical protein [Gammaproteobacteria bacterium]